jgi:hypothetical protein
VIRKLVNEEALALWGLCQKQTKKPPDDEK